MLAFYSPPTLEEMKRQYEVDHVYYTNQLAEILTEMSIDTTLLLVRLNHTVTIGSYFKALCVANGTLIKALLFRRLLTFRI